MRDIPSIGVPVAVSSKRLLLFKCQSTDPISVQRDYQFADDSALIATTRTGAQQAACLYVGVAASFGLTVNLSKTKFMTVGHGVHLDDCLPLQIHDDTIEYVQEFRYLGSIIHSAGRSTAEIQSKITAASRAFGALCRPKFMNGNLSIATKQIVFEACVMSLLLYCSEC